MGVPKKEKRRIRDLVWKNKVDDLKQYPDLSKLLKIRAKGGDSLLQLAITRKSREVFEYLLSIDYPIEFANRFGHTALYTAFKYYFEGPPFFNMYFLNALMEKRADVSVLIDTPYLHWAVERITHVEVAKILIENGVNINKIDENGSTPLHLCLTYPTVESRYCAEIAIMLLVNGADTLIRDSRGQTPFDMSVGANNFDIDLQESLFLYTFDQFTEYKINGSVLIRLAEKNTSFFLHVYKNIVTVDFDWNLRYHSGSIFQIETQILRVLIENFPEMVACKFLTSNSWVNSIHVSNMKLFMSNLYCIYNSKLQQNLIYFLSNAKCDCIPNFIFFDLSSLIDLSVTTELYCFLLSYGVPITEYDIHAVYRQFGYCELFKIMLHMDIEKDKHVEWYSLNDAFPRLCYNFNVNFNECINVDHLLDYYNSPGVKKYCCSLKGDVRIVSKIKSLPKIPLLIELARNVFRKYFFKKLKISSARQFYTLLKKLPISPVHEKIITLETKLY